MLLFTLLPAGSALLAFLFGPRPDQPPAVRAPCSSPTVAGGRARAARAGGYHALCTRPSWWPMRRKAWQRASRCGWACAFSTSPSGTPTGKTPETPACPPSCTGQLPEGWQAGDVAWPLPHPHSNWHLGELRLRRRCAAARARHRAARLGLGRWRKRRGGCACAPPGWCAARNAFPKKASSACACRCRAAWPCTPARVRGGNGHAQPTDLPAHADSRAHIAAPAAGSAEPATLQLRACWPAATLRGQTLQLFVETAGLIEHSAP